MTQAPLHFRSTSELSNAIKSGNLSPVDLTEHLLDRIEKSDGTLNAYREVTRGRAIAEAKAAEAVLSAGRDVGPLHGIPYAVKDLYDVKGFPTRAGTRILDGNIAAADAHSVRRLAEAGMILLGKTHTVQFAFSGIGINNDQGTPRNPWHREPYAPGGSSSGSAVAVSAGLAPMALGSDTGGSIRVPAAMCGTVGLKTTVGRIGRSGVYPLSWTLDSLGPLTRTVEDAAIVYSALQGFDPQDESTHGVTPNNVISGLKDGVKGMRIAFCETVFFDGADAEVERAVREAGRVFDSLGAYVDSIDVPEVEQIMGEENRGLMIAAEGFAVNRKMLEDRFDELDPDVAFRLRPGKKLSASDYIAVWRRWKSLRAKLLHTLHDVDALLVPTAMLPARPIKEIAADKNTYTFFNASYLRNTSLGNFLNLCAVSVPCGFTNDGSPVGLMIYAKPFREETALRAAYAYEQASGWWKKYPDLTKM